MQELPHLYRVEASADASGPVAISSPGLEPIATAPPAEYGGPGDRWSPETLLVASVADCFVLTFRAVARASSLTWGELRCECEGKLDREERVTRFVGIQIQASLAVPAGTDAAMAKRLLEKAERACLISNSLACPVELHAEVIRAESTPGRRTTAGE